MSANHNRKPDNDMQNPVEITVIFSPDLASFYQFAIQNL